MNKTIFTLDKCVVCGLTAGMDKSSDGVTCAREACRDGLSLTIQDLLEDRKLAKKEIEQLKYQFIESFSEGEQDSEEEQDKDNPGYY